MIREPEDLDIFCNSDCSDHSCTPEFAANDCSKVSEGVLGPLHAMSSGRTCMNVVRGMYILYCKYV